MVNVLSQIKPKRGSASIISILFLKEISENVTTYPFSKSISVLVVSYTKYKAQKLVHVERNNLARNLRKILHVQMILIFV